MPGVNICSKVKLAWGTLQTSWDQKVKLEFLHYKFCVMFLSFTSVHSGAQIQVNADNICGSPPIFSNSQLYSWNSCNTCKQGQELNFTYNYKKGYIMYKLYTNNSHISTVVVLILCPTTVEMWLGFVCNLPILYHLKCTTHGLQGLQLKLVAKVIFSSQTDRENKQLPLLNLLSHSGFYFTKWCLPLGTWGVSNNGLVWKHLRILSVNGGHICYYWV